MPTLDDIRRDFPDARNASDLEILNELARRSGKDIGAVAADWNYDAGQNNGDFTRGFKRGWAQTLGSGAGVLAIGADMVGADGVKQWALDRARNQFDRDAILTRKTDDVTNIDSFGSAVDFAQAGLGQLAPMLLGGGVTGIGGRVVGGAIARTAAKEAAETVSKAAITHGLEGEIASAMGNASARRVAEKAAERGMQAGVTGYSIGQEAGSIYPDMVAEGHDDSLRALGFGTVAGLLDAAPELRALSRLTGGNEVAGGVLRRVRNEGLKQMGLEAGTEIAQTGLERQAAYKDLMSPEALNEYINAGALGALGGAVMGGVSAIPGRREMAPIVGQPRDLLATPTDGPAPLPTLNDPVPPVPPAPPAPPTLDTSVLGEPDLPALYERPIEPGAPEQREGFPRLYGTPSERDPRSPLIPPPDTLAVGTTTDNTPVFNAQPVSDTLPGALELARQRALAGPIVGAENAVTGTDGSSAAGSAVAGAGTGNTAAGGAVGVGVRGDAAAPEGSGQATGSLAGQTADDQPALTSAALKAQHGIKETKKKTKAREVEIDRLAALINAGAELSESDIAERMRWLKAGHYDAARQANDVDEGTLFNSLDGAQRVDYLINVLPEEMRDVLRMSLAGMNDVDIAKALGGKDKQWAQKRRTMATNTLIDLVTRRGYDASGIKEALSTVAKSVGGSDTARAEQITALQEQYAVAADDAERADIEHRIRTLEMDGEGVTSNDASRLELHTDGEDDGTSTGFQIKSRGGDTGMDSRFDHASLDNVEFNRDLTGRETDENSVPMQMARDRYNAWRGAADPEWEQWGPQQRERWMKLDQALENENLSDAGFERAGLEMVDEAEQGKFYSRNGAVSTSEDAQGNTWAFRSMDLTSQPKVVEALRRLIASPVGHAFDNISGVFLSEDTGADAFVVPEGDGQYKLVLTKEFLDKASDAEVMRVVNHEAAHVADDSAGAGRYSGDAEWASIVEGVRAKFRGGDRDMTSALRSFLRYPFADTSVSQEALNSEVFAQLWAANRDPALRAATQQALPDAFNFVEDAYGHYTGAEGSTTGQVQRADGQGTGTAEGRGSSRPAGSDTQGRGSEAGAAEGVSFSRAGETQGTTRTAIEAAVRRITAGADSWKVMVVENETDLPTEVRQSVSGQGGQAFVLGRRAYFIASRIRPGTEMAVFLHEVGVHLGMEGLIGTQNLANLSGQIQQWAESGADTQEARIARAAKARMETAETADPEELVAYFVEEAVNAGVDPTAELSDPLGLWFRTFWAAVKSAMRKLGLMRVGELTSTDIVNLAYGAARLEVVGAWHGTAAEFRRFDHNYMNTGEGAQAYGWGTYLAQRKGIADGYWTADVRRKTDVRHDWTYDGEILDPDTTNLREMAELMTAYYAEGYIGNRSALTAANTFGLIPEDAAVVASVAQGLDVTKGGQKATKVKPEGMVARIDINIADDELLDWDKPLSEQNTARIALMPLRKFLAHTADELTGGANWNDMTGEEMYRLVQRALQQDYFDPNLPAVDEALRQGKTDQAASEYLDSIGIKGIKFLDSQSRNSTVNSKLFIDGKEIVPSLMTPSHEVDGHIRLIRNNGNLEAAIKESEDVGDWAETRYLESLRGKKINVESPENKTHNLVIFNDKNILRVNSWVANDKARIRFSKPAPAADADSIVGKLFSAPVRETAKHIGRKVNYSLLFGHQLVDRISAMLPSARAFFRTLQDRITVRDRREARVMEVAEKFYQLPAAEQTKANRFIYESTTSQKWGYKPKWDSAATVDADMASKFQALSPQAQAVVQEVFTYGYETQREYENVLRATKGAELEAQIAEATAAKDTNRVKALEKERAKLLRDNGALKTMLAGPYAPLKRFGKFVVSIKSDKYRAAEAAKDYAEIERLQKNEDDYQVQFFETMYEAQKAYQDLLPRFGDKMDRPFEREPERSRATELPLQAIKRLQEAITNGPNGEKLSARSRRILSRMTSDLYVASLDSLSARQSQQRRRGIHGADEDMMRAFVSQGRGMAHMLSTLEVNEPMQASLQRMRSEARTGRTTEKNDALNEVLNRYTMLMDTRATPWQDKAMAATSVWMLLTSPAYWFGNATQPFMMTLPVLSGRHNATASWSAVLTGYGDMMAALEGRSLDPTKVKATLGRESEMLQELLDRGHIDLTLEREMGELAESGNKTTHWLMSKLRIIPQRVEVANRVASALAAYRLEYARAIKDGASAQVAHDQATEYADTIILDTHGDYSSSGAPRLLMQGNSSMPIKLMGQFRKFQLIQLGLFSKLIRQSFSGKMTPDERTAARHSLAWLLGTYGTMTGLTGIIGSNIIWGILSMFGDDDEKDLDLVLTRALGDRDAAQLLLHGVPALLGVDVSKRIGAGNVLSVFPYADTEPTVKDSYTNYVMAATGPFIGGLLPKMASGVDYIHNGDFWKGTEMLLPSGMGNALRAVRFATEGYTNRKGDMLLSPEDMGPMSAVMQAAGLPTTVLTDRAWKSEVLYKMGQDLTADASRIKKEFAEAARDKDTEAMAELRGEWRHLQEVRERNGMKVQPLSTLLKAPQEQRDREKAAKEGVATTKSNAKFVGTIPD